MAKTKFAITSEAAKPLLAGVGVTDLAFERVRDLVGETQARLSGVQETVADPRALRDRAVTAVSARVDALAKDARARRRAIEGRISDLQADAKAYPAVAVDAYTELAERGESLVGRIRRQPSTKAAVTSAKITASKAKTTTTQAKKATAAARTTAKSTAKTADKKAAVTRSSAKATVTAAQTTASNAAQALADATDKVGD